MSRLSRFFSLTLAVMLVLSVISWNSRVGKNELRLLYNGSIEVVNPMLGARDKNTTPSTGARRKRRESTEAHVVDTGIEKDKRSSEGKTEP